MERKSIGTFLAALRKSNGLTQQEMADRLNVSNKTISKWERDENSPDIALIPVIAELFGVTCDEILLGERFAIGNSPQNKANKVEKQSDVLPPLNASWHLKRGLPGNARPMARYLPGDPRVSHGSKKVLHKDAAPSARC